MGATLEIKRIANDMLRELLSGPKPTNQGVLRDNPLFAVAHEIDLTALSLQDVNASHLKSTACDHGISGFQSCQAVKNFPFRHR